MGKRTSKEILSSKLPNSDQLPDLDLPGFAISPKRSAGMLAMYSLYHYLRTFPTEYQSLLSYEGARREYYNYMSIVAAQKGLSLSSKRFTRKARKASEFEFSYANS